MTSTVSSVVETRYGSVQGVQEGPVYIWRGIPYARPPVGSLRFQPPQPPEPWTGMRDATHFGAICPQIPNAFYQTDQDQTSFDEDCLYLNIWSPGPDDKRRPVMVWIHGGAYHSGSGQQFIYDGTSFATQGDVVLVTINYRLGPLGFLYLAELGGSDYASSGNCGILDQIAALKWVKENIAAFGGDPGRVTVFGESAGSMSIGTLLSMPQAEGLFQQAILQSGIPLGGLQSCDVRTAAARTEHVLNNLPVRVTDIETLLNIPAEQLVEATRAFNQNPLMPWRPVVDGVVIQQTLQDSLHTGKAINVPMILGCNLNELSLWIANDPSIASLSDEARLQRFESSLGPIAPELRSFYVEGSTGIGLVDQLIQMGSYGQFALPIQILAMYLIERTPMWVYRFDWQSTVAGGIYKAAHAMELPFVFNTVQHPATTAFTGESPDRERIASQMHQAWIAFAHHGDPGGTSLPDWPRYDLNERPTMIYDTHTRVERDPYGEERKVWERLLLPR